MPLISWSDEYSVNIKNMDNEHKKLIDIINKLYDAMKIGKSNEVLNDVFKELVDYTMTHFTHEEMLMEQEKYPGLSVQKQQHQLFVAKIQEQLDKYKNGVLFVGVEISNYLKEWLINHIQQFDKSYGRFLNAKGLS